MVVISSVVIICLVTINNQYIHYYSYYYYQYRAFLKLTFWVGFVLGFVFQTFVTFLYHIMKNIVCTP